MYGVLNDIFRRYLLLGPYWKLFTYCATIIFMRGMVAWFKRKKMSASKCLLIVLLFFYLLTVYTSTVLARTQRLRETIKGSLEIMDGDYYAVLTGCSMGINGDDVDSVVKEFEASPYPIASIDTAGFRGDTYTGYNMALLATVKKLAKNR